jgi:pyruvate dehydrogenase E2 component (dihydrolipoamide acetyltransferase)
MRTEITVPVLSEEDEEGMVVTWFVTPGAAVREGDLLAEVQVEKAVTEIRAPAAGRVAEILVPAGGIVRRATPIAVLEVGAEAVPEAAPAPVGAAAGAEAVREAAEPAPAGAPPPASPAARRLARELGVDLASVRGSGPGGRILEQDVRAAVGAPAAPAPAAPARVEPLTPMRKAIAARLTAGLASAAQLTLTAEADVTDLTATLERAGGDGAVRPSITDAVVRAAALALREHRRVAARWTDDGLVLPEALDVGVAVAVEGGLLVPVVRGADHKDVATLSREIAELAERARWGRLQAPEMEGPVLSVTNLGAYRIDAFTPLLDPPQSVVLGVGRARMRPAVRDGAIVPRQLMVLSLTFDHRVSDGAPAAAYLQDVVLLLEDPGRLLR